MTTAITNTQMTADEIASFCDEYKCSIFYSKGRWWAMHTDEVRTVCDPDFESIVAHVLKSWSDGRDSDPHCPA